MLLYNNYVKDTDELIIRNHNINYLIYKYYSMIKLYDLTLK